MTTSVRDPGCDPVWWIVALIVAMSGVAHFVGIHRDLPSPDVDEPFFVLPPVQMASSGSLDPHWFGHPGSTVILPLAVAYRAREVLFHGAPLFGPAPSVTTRFRSDEDSFFLLGRLWTVFLTSRAWCSSSSSHGACSTRPSG